MTANLTVPADVWACKQPGVPFVAAIVEGEIVASSAPMFPDSNLPGTSSIPPAWLVALRDARCETCEGHGYRVHPEDGSSEPCDDGCHDGRLLHDVRVECDFCEGAGTHPNGDKSHLCPECDGDGHRTVRCLVDAAEVRALPTAGVCKVKDDHLDVHGTEAVLYVLGGYDGDLTPAHVDALAAACGKPPADWVGKYAVILTEVGE